jgi:hypothetical protein
LSALFTGNRVEFNWTEEDRNLSVDELDEPTRLDFDVVQLILNNPEKASFGDILLYCENLKIDPHAFLQSFLDKKYGLVYA